MNNVFYYQKMEYLPTQKCTYDNHNAAARMLNFIFLKILLHSFLIDEIYVLCLGTVYTLHYSDKFLAYCVIIKCYQQVACFSFFLFKSEKTQLCTV